MGRKAASESDEAPDGVDDGGLSGLIGFHLRMANVALYRDFTQAMVDVDLTQRQAATLFLIAANPGTPQVAIAQHMGADRATIMAMVDRLEKRGLITRHRSKADRRRQELNLTDKGAKVLDAAKARITVHEARFTKGLSAEEVKTLTTLLGRLHSQ